MHPLGARLLGFEPQLGCGRGHGGTSSRRCGQCRSTTSPSAAIGRSVSRTTRTTRATSPDRSATSGRTGQNSPRTSGTAPGLAGRRSGARWVVASAVKRQRALSQLAYGSGARRDPRSAASLRSAAARTRAYGAAVITRTRDPPSGTCRSWLSGRPGRCSRPGRLTTMPWTAGVMRWSGPPRGRPDQVRDPPAGRLRALYPRPHLRRRGRRPAVTRRACAGVPEGISGACQPPRIRQSAWSERRIGDLHPGGP